MNAELSHAIAQNMPEIVKVLACLGMLSLFIIAALGGLFIITRFDKSDSNELEEDE